MGEFLLAMFIFSFAMANIGSIFICLYAAFNRQYNVPMILVALYGFMGTFVVGIVFFLLFIFAKIEETKFWQKLSKMREF
ncbi:hypothetical protein VH12019_00369 [Vibrio phage VH1_2019]|uniref:Uncharacterized protein n=1 Tax=Vibrio phage VH1_2019 TaxID=2686307 RepID=A0A6B9SVG5_9CAUD|nr:hypothetical protein VH12019_00369 [Vibrio phage VH1_2019]